MSRQVGSLHRSISHPANLQKPIPIIPLFDFPPPISPHVNRYPAWILTLIQTSPFLTQFLNLVTQTSKPQTNLQNPNPAHQHFLNPPFDPFTPNPQMIPPVPFLMIPKQPRHNLPLPMTVPTIIPQKPRKSHKN